MTYPDFEARWKNSGGAERANYRLFLQGLCDLLEVPRPNPTTDDPTQDSYVLERAVQFNDGAKKSTGRIGLYKRTKTEKVQPLLDTLTAMNLLRHTEEGAYAA